MDAILVLNAGSSSLKFQAFAANDLRVLLAGKVTGIGGPARLGVNFPKGIAGRDLGKADHHGALTAVLECIEAHDDDWTVTVIAHRVVHGGTRFTAPVLIDDAVLAELSELVPLAPLHQPHNLDAIVASRALAPDAADVACFDTAFHAGQDPLFTTLALPADIRGRGIRRYGFHGISYEWLALSLRKSRPELAAGRVVAAHLGNGASVCAMLNGESVESSMGMTALDGLPMGTRCGAIDPGVVTTLAREGCTPDEVDAILYNRSGLKGLSGISNDVATLLASDAEEARFALDFFALKVAQFAAMLSVSMGGLDALIFSAGIGENAAPVRDAVVRRLAHLRPFETLVIPTDEERMMAIHARKFIEATFPDDQCAD